MNELRITGIGLGLGLLVLGMSLACDVGNDDPQPGDSATAGDTDGGGDELLDSCEPRPQSCAAGDHWVPRIVGTVVDEVGEGIEGARLTLCLDGGVCLSSTTAADGGFAFNVPARNACFQSAVTRVFLPNSQWTTAYCQIAVEDAACPLVVTEPFVLYPTTPATTLPTLGDEDAERTVVFADGLEIDFIPSGVYPSGGYDDLAVAKVATDAAGLCFLEGAPAVEALYGFSPEGDVKDGTFSVRIPNSTGLDADAQVDLWLLGALNCKVAGTTVGEGIWTKFQTSTVNSSGTLIEAQLPCLSWFGYSLR